jgi:hypothetical protein
VLSAAFAVLSAAVLLGLLLAALYLRAADDRYPHWSIGAAHGTIGAIGLALLLAALGEPTRGVALGAGSFRLIAAAMLGTALLAGLTIPLLWRRRRALLSATIALHAIVAVAGYLILATYVTL